MKIYIILFISLSTFLFAHCGGCEVSKDSLRHIKIGNISIHLDESGKKVEVKNRKKTFNFNTEAWNSHLLLINDLYMERICFDGMPVTHEELVDYKNHVWDKYSDYDKRVLDGAYIYIDKVNLEKKDIKLFPFFSEEPTTIGFYELSVGMTGRSSGTFYLFDIIDDYSAVFHSSICGSLPFSESDDYPPNIIITEDIYLGNYNNPFGWKKRISEIHSFYNGMYVRDELEEKKMFKQYYNNSILTEEELRELRHPYNEKESNVDENKFHEIYIKFVDFLYYGKLLGEIQEIEDILNKVHPDLKKYIIEDSMIRYVDPYWSPK